MEKLSRFPYLRMKLFTFHWKGKLLWATYAAPKDIGLCLTDFSKNIPAAKCLIPMEYLLEFLM